MSELQVISESDESGIKILISRDEKQIFVIGHSEYGPFKLKEEYLRDLQKGEKILVNERAWSISIEEGKNTVLWLNEAALYRLPGTIKIKLEWNDNKFEATDVQFVIE